MCSIRKRLTYISVLHHVHMVEQARSIEHTLALGMSAMIYPIRGILPRAIHRSRTLSSRLHFPRCQPPRLSC